MADLGSTEGIKKAADQQTKVGDRSQGSNMPKMWKPGTLSVEMLLEKVQAGQLALPQFQRPAVWGKNWLPFRPCCSVNRPGLCYRWTSETSRTPLRRAIEDAPRNNTDNLETLLLTAGGERQPSFGRKASSTRRCLESDRSGPSRDTGRRLEKNILS